MLFIECQESIMSPLYLSALVCAAAIARNRINQEETHLLLLVLKAPLFLLVLNYCR